MNRKLMDEVEDHAPYEERCPREDLLSHQMNNNHPSHLRAHLSNLPLTEAIETIITEPVIHDPHQQTLLQAPKILLSETPST